MCCWTRVIRLRAGAEGGLVLGGCHFASFAQEWKISAVLCLGVLAAIVWETRFKAATTNGDHRSRNGARPWCRNAEPDQGYFLSDK